MEQRAQEIIKQELSINALSYEEEKNKHGYTGFMDVYLKHSINYKKMSTSADFNVMSELASIDQFRNQNKIFDNFLKLWKVTSFPKKVIIQIFLWKITLVDSFISHWGRLLLSLYLHAVLNVQKSNSLKASSN